MTEWWFEWYFRSLDFSCCVLAFTTLLILFCVKWHWSDIVHL